MQQDMTKDRILPIILGFTWPLFVGNIFQQFYNMADTIIVGRYVGAGALAAVGSTGTIMFLIIGFALGMTAGFAVLTSQTFGSGDLEGVKRSVANGTILALMITVAVTSIGLLCMPAILKLMNTPADIMDDARTYITIICKYLIANMMYNLFSAYLRAVGNSKAPLFFLVFSACLNVGLDLLFIIYLHMGVAGAARATVLSQGISAFLCFVYMYWKVPVLMPERKHWRLGRKETVYQLKIGIPMTLQYAITASGTMIMQSAINLFGSTAVAAFTAATKVQNVVTQGMIALGQTMAAYCGQNFGAGKISRIEKGTQIASIIAVIYSLGATALVYFLLPNMLGLFFSGDVSITELLPWAKTYAYLSMLFYIPLSMIFIYRNSMQGCGYSFLPMMGGVLELVARAVTAVIGIYTHSYLISVACDPAAWLFTGIYVIVAYQWVIRDMKKKAGH